MKQGIFTCEAIRALTADTYELRLAGDTSAITAPGQFVNILVDGYYLRRPLSVCDWGDGTLTLIFKVVGGGTQALSQCAPGDTLDILSGLGNGYTLQGSAPLLIGGGVGVPPLYGLAKAFLRAGITPRVYLGFRTPGDVFYRGEFASLGCAVSVATGDEFVTDRIRAENPVYDAYFACGPEPMLRAVARSCTGEGQLSFEARMGCGFGACVGCTCRTLTGNKRICVDGPVLRASDVIWE